MKNKLHKERGFTLVELMVVVAIIGILAAIGIPQMTRFIKNAETAEPISQAGRIEKSIGGYIDAHSSSTTAALATAINTNNSVVDACAANCLTDLIPEAVVPANHAWSYTVSVAIDATTRASAVCIMAAEIGGAAGEEIYYSTSRSALPEWNNHALTRMYVAGAAFIAGGSCSAATPTATITPIG